MNRNANHSMSAGQIIGTMNGLQVFGLDIAKQVFQVHTVNMRTGEIINEQIKQANVLEHFANRVSCVIGIEACGGANYWVSELRGLGHNVKLIPTANVRPFVTGNKTDATDARDIWLAIEQPRVKFVAVKTFEQQATLTLHRQRKQLVKMRLMQTNALRGLLYEFGATFAKGTTALFKEVQATLEVLQSQLPQILGHISKRGDKYVRTLLIHGARAALCRIKEPSAWRVALKERRPTKVVIVAQTAKMARTIWAVTAKEQEYQRGHQSVRPAMA